MAYLLKELSVFFPVYNLEAQIKDTLVNALETIPNLAEKYEIIVVNDGSYDRTGEILSEIAKKNTNIRIITHKNNRGYGGALKSGFYGSKYEWIAFTDADGQFDISELPNLINLQKRTKADLVVGYYMKRAVKFYRKVNTWLWQLVVRILFGLNVKDIDCGFKLISKKVLSGIDPLESERGAFVSSEFLIKAQKEGFKIVEIGVHHYPRTEGRGTGADLNVIIRSFIDLFKLWKKLR